MFLKPQNIHLLISAAIVIPAAIIYGFFPEFFLNFEVKNNNLNSILKSTMMLYCAFALLWLLRSYKIEYWKTATICNFIFMLALGFGRLISILIDEKPTTIFLLGMIGELGLGFYGVIAYHYFKNSQLTT